MDPYYAQAAAAMQHSNDPATQAAKAAAAAAAAAAAHAAAAEAASQTLPYGMAGMHPGAGMPPGAHPYMQYMQPHMAMAPGPQHGMMWNPYAAHMGMVPQQQVAPPQYPGLAGLTIPTRTRCSEREDASGRWVLEPEDVLLLERVFALEKCPGRELRAQLAQRLHVKPRQIQVWFQNKRQRTKNGAKPTVAEALAHAVYSSEHRTQKEPAELLMNMAHGASGSADEGGSPKGETTAPLLSTSADAGTSGRMSNAHGTMTVPSQAAACNAAATAAALVAAASSAEGRGSNHGNSGSGNGGGGAATYDPPAAAPEAVKRAITPTAHAELSGQANGLLAAAACNANGAPPAAPAAAIEATASHPSLSMPPAAALEAALVPDPGAGAPATEGSGTPPSMLVAPNASAPGVNGVNGAPEHHGYPHGAPVDHHAASMAAANAAAAAANAAAAAAAAANAAASGAALAAPGANGPVPGPNGQYPDGFTDGHMLWVRSDILMMRPELLGADATPIFVAPDGRTVGAAPGQQPPGYPPPGVLPGMPPAHMMQQPAMAAPAVAPSAVQASAVPASTVPADAAPVRGLPMVRSNTQEACGALFALSDAGAAAAGAPALPGSAMEVVPVGAVGGGDAPQAIAEAELPGGVRAADTSAKVDEELE